MPKTYSYSRITTFEKCPLKFKFRYIDEIIPEVEKSIEAHLGKSVHSALEWLYKKVKLGIVPNIEEAILSYSREWEKDFNDQILIVNRNLTPQDYFNKGIQFITTYYTQHHPFNDNTIEIEKRILIHLDESGDYRIQGFIDRLTYNLQTGEYEIHDYKTANSLPSAEKIESDKQLALYSIAIKETYGRDKEVKMIWHFLAYNKRIQKKKTNEELDALRLETLETIKKIEATKVFPPIKSSLCHWCEYKSICPAWGNKPPRLEKQKTLDQMEKETKFEDINPIEKRELLDIFD
ncbi:PD-(D/E)XK nuclease family protein [Candidatus Pacearchaeota archaeon]|nr:PD-(D/E)XK nuclease family protein [Candidatus Pacearchaeota archaeon]